MTKIVLNLDSITDAVQPDYQKRLEDWQKVDCEINRAFYSNPPPSSYKQTGLGLRLILAIIVVAAG